MDDAVFGGIDDESDDEDDAESSVDLFIRFMQSMFKKMSKRAKKASRSVLPGVISPQLVSFPSSLHYFGVLKPLFQMGIKTKLLSLL